MIAFCIIIGDSIPHVMAAIFPGIEHVPVLSLLTNRRVVIVLVTMGVGYPLSLYRDIAKVCLSIREVNKTWSMRVLIVHSWLKLARLPC